jgi:SAM-dependent methyltransferase
MTEQKDTQDIRTVVRQHYGQIAEQFQAGAKADCGCSTSSSSCCGPSAEQIDVQLDSITRLYEAPEVTQLPEDVTGLSLGCGDPITLATLKPGETVLDLGSGGGIDCFLAGKRVGPTGHVIGVDMTPQMLEQARLNRQKVGASNVEFRLGEIEHLPAADASVDVIISNCVINLSPDKPQVFREAFRALKPGGRLAVSDIVTDGPLPDGLKASLSAWAGCVAGALEVKDYIAAITAAGFEEVQLTPVYFPQEVVVEAVNQLGERVDLSELSPELASQAVFSAKISARKPAPLG